MALTVHHWVSNGDTNNVTNYATGSFTPTGNALLIACFTAARGSSLDPDLPAVSNTGTVLSWTKIADFNWITTTATHMRLNIWAAQTGASPGAMTVTAVYANALTGVGWSVFDVTGSDVGAGLAQAFRNPTTTTANPTSATSLSITQPGAANSANRTFLFAVHGAAEGYNIQANWTLIGAGTHTAPTIGVSSQWRSDAFDTAVSTSWTTSSAFAGISFEIKAAIIPAALGSYALASPSATNLIFGHRLVAAKGAIALASPSATGLSKARAPLVAATAAFAFADKGTILRATRSIKASPTGVFELLTAPNGVFWTNIGTKASLNYDFSDGFRGRAGVANVWPNHGSDSPIFSDIDGALNTVDPFSKDISLSFALGASAPEWFYDESPTVPRFYIDPLDFTNDEQFNDGVYNSTTLITSATAYFVAARDQGLGITDGGLSIPVGATIVTVNSPTSINISAPTTSSGPAKNFTITARPGRQPNIFHPNYLPKIRPLIFAVGAHYDADPRVPYIAATMFMQNNEMYVSKTNGDDALWETEAQTYYGVPKRTAFLIVASQIMKWFMEAFPRTPIMLTSAKPFLNFTIGNGTRADVENWVATQNRNHEIGLMIASEHATTTYGAPVRGERIAGSQWIFSTARPDDFYVPAIIPIPADPQPVNDMLGATLANERAFTEAYTADLQDTANASTFRTRRAQLRDNLLNQVGADLGKFVLASPAVTLTKGTGGRTLTAAVGNFALASPSATNLLFGLRVGAVKNAIALASPSATNLIHGYRVIAAKYGIALNSPSLNLVFAHRVVAAKYALALSLKDAALIRTTIMPLDKGSFALALKSANVLRGRRLVAALRSFALNFIDATFDVALPLEPGSFALNGQAIAARVDRRLSADKGTFDLNGQAVTVRLARRLAADKGAFDLTGQAVAVRLVRRLSADKATFDLAGQSIFFGGQKHFAALGGDFLLSGKDLAARIDHRLSAVQGAFALSGKDAQARIAHVLAAAKGAIALAGQDVALSKTSASQMAAAPAAFLLNGQAISLRTDRKLTAAQGGFALSGQAIGTIFAHVMAADRGALILTGKDVGLTKIAAGAIGAGRGSFALAGGSVGFLYGHVLSAQGAPIALDGQGALLVKGRGFQAAGGAFSLSGHDLGFVTLRVLAADAANFQVLGQIVHPFHGRFILIDAGEFVADGQAAALSRSRRQIAARGQFLLHGQLVEMIFGNREGNVFQEGVFVAVGISQDEAPDKTSLAQSAALVLKTSGKTIFLP